MDIQFEYFWKRLIRRQISETYFPFFVPYFPYYIFYNSEELQFVVQPTFSKIIRVKCKQIFVSIIYLSTFPHLAN